MLNPLTVDKLQGKPRAKVWAIALCSAPLMTLSQPPAAVPGLGLVALVPLLIALPRLSAGGAWLASFLVGLMYYAVNIWWLGEMTTDPGSEIYMFFMFAFVATYMATGYGIAGMVLRWMLTRQQRWLIWLIPIAWLGHEFAHEYHIPAPFPWLSVAYSVSDITPFIQTADIWGAYGIAAAVILVNLAIARAFELRGSSAVLAVNRAGPYRLSLPIVACVVLIGGSIYGWVRMGHIDSIASEQGPLIGCVQGNLAQEVKVRHDRKRIPLSFRKHLDLTAQAVEAGAELVCWPETMVPYGSTREGLWPHDPEDSAQYFPDGIPSATLLEPSWTDSSGEKRSAAYIERLRAKIAHEFKTPMLVGASTPIPEEERVEDWKDYDGRRHNSAILFDRQGRYVAGYDKRYIVPGGEYIPLEGNFIIRKIVEAYAKELQGFASYVEPGLRHTLFRLPNGAAESTDGEWSFTSSICYEYAWPGSFVELHESASPYPDFHVNLSNEGWFKKSAELDQAVNYCRFRCIESRVPMIRATNTGVTCSIDATGRVRDVLTVDGVDRLVQGVMLARPRVLATTGPTIFVALVKRRLGLASLALIVVILAMMAVGRFRDSRLRRATKRREAEVKQRAPKRPGSSPAFGSRKTRKRRRTKA